jgi:hypothetical protein
MAAAPPVRAHALNAAPSVALRARAPRAPRARAPLRVLAARQGRGGRFPATPHVEGHALATAAADAAAAAAACDAWRGGSTGAAVLARWAALPCPPSEMAPGGAAGGVGGGRDGGASLLAFFLALSRLRTLPLRMTRRTLHNPRPAADACLHRRRRRCARGVAAAAGNLQRRCVPCGAPAADEPAARSQRRNRPRGALCLGGRAAAGLGPVCCADACAAPAAAPHALSSRRGALHACLNVFPNLF